MHIVFVHTPMATVSIPERVGFWRSFDRRYHGAHPGLRHMRKVLWELPHWMTWLAGVLFESGFTSLQAMDLYAAESSFAHVDADRIEACLRQTPGEVYLFSPMIPNLPFALQIADIVKSVYPHAITIFGGVTTIPLHKTIAAHPSVDYVVRGRGEYVLPELLTALGTGGSSATQCVESLSFKGHQGNVVSSPLTTRWMPVREIAFPKVDLFPSEIGQDIRYLRQVYALGCPYNCSFCTIETINRRADYFPISRVLAEIRAYRGYYGNHHNIYFGDETFTANKQRTIELCSALKEDGTIYYDCQTRPNLLHDSGLLRALKESGNRWIEVGIETVDQDTMKAHKQNMKLQQLTEILTRVHGEGIAVCAFMVNGFPNLSIDQMKESVEATCNLIQKNLLQASYLFGLVPYPGSALYSHPGAHGIEILHNDWQYYHEELPPVFKSQNAQPDEVYEVFLQGLRQLTCAMEGSSDLFNMPPAAEREKYGAFWNRAHV